MSLINLPPGAELEEKPHDVGECPTTQLEDYRNHLSEYVNEMVKIENAAALRLRGERTLLQEDENDLRDQVERDVKGLCRQLLDHWTAREKGHER